LIVGFGMGMIIIGMLLMILDMMIPPTLIGDPLMFMMFKIMGVGFSSIGIMIVAGRIFQTGVGPFLDLPNTSRVILMHQRRGKTPNARFIPAKLDDLEYIRSKNKIFKDTGGGFRICGHDVRRTHEMISFDMPDWLTQYFYQIKQKYGVNGSDEFKQLQKKLHELKPPIENTLTLEEQLKKIELLKPIMDKPTYKQVLLDMDYTQLRNMEQLLFDGQVHHAEEAESFIESATPNELSVLEKQKFLNEKMEEKHYKDVGEHNFGQWIGPIVILMIGGVIAVAMLAGIFQ